MSQARTVIIVSYWFAPSPAVGAKRFSFLAREFARLGYDVHVITHESREWTQWKSDGSLPLAGQVHRCAETLKLPLAGKGLLHRAFNAVLGRLLAPVGWEYFWAGAATRKALEVARKLPAGVVIATSPAAAALLAGDRIARRLGWPLILDYRDPWSAHPWPRWRRGTLAQWFSRRLEQRLVKRSAARVLNTPAMRASFEKFIPGSEITRNFVIPNGFESVGRCAAAARFRPDLHRARRRDLYRPLAGAGAERRGAAARALSRAAHPRDHLRRPSSRRARPHPRSSSSSHTSRYARAFPSASCSPNCSARTCCWPWSATTCPIPHLIRCTTTWPPAGRYSALAPRGAALFDLLQESGAGVCIDPDDADLIEQALERFMHGDFAPARARVDRYRWSNLALQYRTVIENVAGARSDPVLDEPSASSAKVIDL